MADGTRKDEPLQLDRLHRDLRDRRDRLRNQRPLHNGSKSSQQNDDRTSWLTARARTSRCSLIVCIAISEPVATDYAIRARFTTVRNRRSKTMTGHHG